jgi:hypothetical protein
MTEVNVTQAPPEPEVVYVHDVASPEAAGINLATVLIALVVLVALVAALFYVFPMMFGTGSVNINVRG